MGDREFRTFSRIHKYENPSDIEKGKVKRETANFIRFSKKSEKLSKKITREFSDSDESIFEECAKYQLIAKNEKRNAKVHKNRLKKLEKNEEFY